MAYDCREPPQVPCAPGKAIFALTTSLRQSQTRMVPCTAVVTALEPSLLNENETDANPRGRRAVTARHRWHDPSRSVGRSCDWLLSVAALARTSGPCDPCRRDRRDPDDRRNRPFRLGRRSGRFPAWPKPSGRVRPRLRARAPRSARPENSAATHVSSAFGSRPGGCVRLTRPVPKLDPGASDRHRLAEPCCLLNLPSADVRLSRRRGQHENDSVAAVNEIAEPLLPVLAAEIPCRSSNVSKPQKARAASS
jgi:hypothetical protein